MLFPLACALRQRPATNGLWLFWTLVSPDNITGLRLEVASMLYILDQGDEGTARVSDKVFEWKLGRENRCTMSWSNIFQHEFEHFSSPSRPVPGRCVATDSIHLVAQLCTSIVSLGVSGPCLQGENHHRQIDTLHRTIVFLREWIASRYLPNHHCHSFGGCIAFLTERQWEVRSRVALSFSGLCWPGRWKEWWPCYK